MDTATNQLPISLDWYRQAASWIVGLSTGAVALSLTAVGELKKQAPGTKLLAGFTGGTLVLTVIVGVYLYLFIVNFANVREIKQDRQRKLVTTRDSPARKQLEVKIGKDDEKEREYLKSINVYYRVLIALFPLSLLFIVGTITASVVISNNPEGDYQIVQLSGAGSLTGRVIILDKKTGRMWEISEAGPAGTAMRAVPVQREVVVQSRSRPAGAPASPGRSTVRDTTAFRR